MEKDRVQNYCELLERQEDLALEYVEDQDMNTASLSALEFFISLDLPQDQYESLMKIFENFATRPHPPFFKLQGWLMSCSPPVEFIQDWEEEVKVELQALMQHTAERIIEMNATDIECLVANSGQDTVDMTLFSTWSLDSATVDEGCLSSSWSFFTGNDVLTASVTPIKMIMNNDIEQTIWFNAMPSSIRFCRPLMVEYVAKDIDLIRETKLGIEQDIADLQRIRVILPSGKNVVHVNFRFTLSLTDENALEYIPEASKAGNCLICGATPGEMNKMEVFEAVAKEHTPPYYSFTPLHIWVRFFEFLMEISFRSKLGQWMITDSTKDQYQQRKQEITHQIYAKFDDPENPKRKSGEITQRAFANPTELSNLLEINEELIVRFRNIAIALNVKDPINPFKLDNYCKETYRHYLSLYSWCRIPTAVHQVLAHGAEVCIHAPAPLAFLAEELSVPQKVFLNSRQTHHTRERNHRLKLMDAFMRAMHGSDPVISSGWVQRRRKHRYNQGYPLAVMDILMYEDEGSDREEDDDDETPMKELEYDVRLIDIDFCKFDD